MITSYNHLSLYQEYIDWLNLDKPVKLIQKDGCNTGKFWICITKEQLDEIINYRFDILSKEALVFYEMVKGVEVAKVGFCLSDCKRYGASPDGLVGEDGLLEIKCPTIAVHVGYLLDKTFPMDYFQQIQGQLFVTGRQWSDFLSYYPGLPPLLIRVTPDVVFHRYLGAELNAFCGELEQIILRIS